MEFYDFPIILDTSSSQLTPSFFRLGLAATTNQILWTLYSADQRTFTPRLRVVVIATGSHVEHLAAERFNSCENLYHLIHRWDPVCQMCWWFKKTPHKWWVISPSSWVVSFCWDMDHHCWGFTRKNVVLLQWIMSPPDQHGQRAGGVKFIVPYNLGMIGWHEPWFLRWVTLW